MALTWCGGAEIDVRVLSADCGSVLSGSFTRDTNAGRSGSGPCAYKCDSGVGNAAAYGSAPVAASVNSHFFRGFLRIVTSSLPSSTVRILTIGDGTIPFSARLTSGGKLQLWDASAQIGSDSAATLAADNTTQYRVEMQITMDASLNISFVELRLDGVTVASQTPGTPANFSGSVFDFGWRDAPGASKVIYWDDIQVNDSTGAANNTWPGDTHIILMKPSSDSQRGSWTGGVGGTTNLWDAVNNTPPVGTATETDASQIESTDSSGDNATDEYRGDCGSYITAGLGASDTVNGLRAIINHGEDVSTNTKTGSFGFQANPAVAYATFTFGADVGALGTYPSNWSWATNAEVLSDAPSVTLASSLILAVRKTDAGTRVASVDFLGAYVIFTPAVAAKALVAPSRYRRNPLITR